MTRTFAGLVLSTLLTTGAASASSFVTPEPVTTRLGPSMIALGEPAHAVAGARDRASLDYPFPGGEGNPGLPSADDADFVRVSPSIIAMVEPEPAVSFEQVAAVDKDTSGEDTVRHGLFGPGPIVIRGGVIDNGSAPAITEPAAPTKKPEVAGKTPERPAPSRPDPDKPLPPNGLVGRNWHP